MGIVYLRFCGCSITFQSVVVKEWQIRECYLSSAWQKEAQTVDSRTDVSITKYPKHKKQNITHIGSESCVLSPYIVRTSQYWVPTSYIYFRFFIYFFQFRLAIHVQCSSVRLLTSFIFTKTQLFHSRKHVNKITPCSIGQCGYSSIYGIFTDVELDRCLLLHDGRHGNQNWKQNSKYIMGCKRNMHLYKPLAVQQVYANRRT